MALITDQTKRLVPPHEPESWFDVRTMRAGDVEGFDVEGGAIRISYELLAGLIKGWSYDAPISVDTVKTLDLDTYSWLIQQLKEFSGVRGTEEKKASNAGLSRRPTTRGTGRGS